MSSTKTCDLENLAAEMPSGIEHLIVSASYEERAFGIWKLLNPVISGSKFICYNKNHLSYLKESLGKFQYLDPSAQSVPIDSDDPKITFNSLRLVIDSLRSEHPCHIGIDCTGFTRESLAILLRIARDLLPAESSVTAFYHKASSYGQTTRKGWLSQGVREIRSVLGYSGRMRLSVDTHLMLVAGFETERAQEIIDALEPSQLSLGKLSGIPNGDVDNPHNTTLESFIGRVKSAYANAKIDDFEFSTSDPFYTRDKIIEVATKSRANVVISCLNSKPAMIGCCLAAFELPKIQLIYAQPLRYNIKCYSRCSNSIQFFTFPIN